MPPASLTLHREEGGWLCPCCFGLCLVIPGQGCLQHLYVPHTFAIAGRKSPAFLFLLEVNVRQSPVLLSLSSGHLPAATSEVVMGQGGCKCTRSTRTSTLAVRFGSFCPIYPGTPVTQCNVSSKPVPVKLKLCTTLLSLCRAIKGSMSFPC